MKKILLLLCLVWIGDHPSAQNTTTKLIDGAKTFVELVKIVRPQLYNNTVAGSTDISFINKTSNTTEVYLYRKKNDTAYLQIPLQLTILPQGTETYIDMQEGVYRYRISSRNAVNNSKEIVKEGECRLLLNEKKMIMILR